jgi:putative sporulation protein YtaF
MHFFATSFMLAIAVSLDGLGAGIAYGLKKIRIPVVSLMIIGLVTVFAMGMAIGAATWLSSFISLRVAWAIGALLLIGLGIWSILQEWLKQYLPEDTQVYPRAELKFDMGVFRMVIQVFKRPTEADVDHSGELNPGEAVVLGLALALDALVAGFGAALAGGISWWTPGVVGVVQLIFITIGTRIAVAAVPPALEKKFPYLPGGILIVIGLLRFW